MRVYEYRKLKRACIIFGILILLLNCTEWGIEQIALKIIEILFLVYLACWLDKDAVKKEYYKLLFFCVFIVGAGFGNLINNIVAKLIVTIITILAAMLYLYSIRIRVSYDRKFLIHFFSSVIYLPFAYVYDFLKKEEYTRIERIKQQRIFNGIFVSLTITLFGIIPLYANGDAVFKGWLEIGVGWLLENVFCFSVAIGFCWVPAMLIYSYVKGICMENVNDNITINIISNVDKKKMFLNKFSVKAILISGGVVNLLFTCTQIAYFFEVNKKYEEISSIGNMVSIFGAIIINVVLLTVTALVIKEKRINEYSDSIASLNIYYAISIIAVWIAFLWRYLISIYKYGLKGIWTIWGLAILLLIAVVSWNISNVLYNYERLIKISCYGISVLFVIFNICLPEYWIGKINIKIYDYKYNNGLLKYVSEDIFREDMSNIIVAEQDLDMEYLKTLQIWAIPALLDVIDVDNYYEETGKTVGAIAKETIIEILEKDLTEENREVMKKMDNDEKIRYMCMQLEKKLDYRLLGQKRVILEALKQAYA